MPSPAIPSADRAKLRMNLIDEEVNELREAIKQNDLVECADALADIQYVLSGTVLEFGMGGVFKSLFDEVHRSNMSKLCKDEEEAKATVAHYKQNKATDASYRLATSGHGYQVYRLSDNKTLKSVKYSEASLEPILKEGQAMATAAEASPCDVKAKAVAEAATETEEEAEAEEEPTAGIKEAVSKMRALLDQLEGGEVRGEMSAELNANHDELQSLLGKRKAPEAGQ